MYMKIDNILHISFHNFYHICIFFVFSFWLIKQTNTQFTYSFRPPLESDSPTGKINTQIHPKI